MFTARYELIPYIKQITFRIYKIKLQRTIQSALSRGATGVLYVAVTPAQDGRAVNADFANH